MRVRPQIGRTEPMETENFQYWTFLAGVSFFLIGMRNLESALKVLAGRNFKLLLRNYSSIPIVGVVIGTITTAILQSSSVVTLMVIALVGAGALPLINAVSIVFGANLGTTFTGWIVSFLGFSINMETYIFPLIAAGGLTYIFITKFARLLHLGQFILGLGLLLFGMTTMKTSIEDVQSVIDIEKFAVLGVLSFALAGFLITSLIQSSSATMVIALSALNSGVLELPMAAAMVAGSDLGSSMTAIIGTLGGTSTKKRVALGHFFFNLTNNVIALSALPILLSIVTYTFSDSTPLIQLVAFHSLINLVGLFIFTPLIKPYTAFLERRFTKSSDNRLLVPSDTTLPEAALQSLHTSVQKFIQAVAEVYLDALRINKTQALHLYRPQEILTKIFGREELFTKKYQFIKDQEGEILNFSLEIQKGTLTEAQGRMLVHCIQALREAGLAAKDLKDIEHNIREMEASAESAVYQAFENIQDSLLKFLAQVEKIQLATETKSANDLLSIAEKDSVDFNTHFTRDLHEAIKHQQVSLGVSSSMLNANRELFSSRRHLLTALRILKLNNGQ